MTFRIFLVAILTFMTIISNCQEKVISSKCGNCQQAVSSNSKVGDRCPHCKVIWGKENKSIINNYLNRNKPESSFNYGNNENSVSNKKKGVVYDSFFKNFNRSSLENWITSNLNENTMKYSKYTEYSSKYYYDFDFRFDREYLVIKYMVKVVNTSSFLYSLGGSGTSNTTVTKEVQFLPLYYFDNIRRTENSPMYKETNLLFINRTHPQEIIENSSCNSIILSSLNLLVDFGRNNDFDEYLEAAFKQLSLFYKRPNLNFVPNCESY